MSTHQHVHSLTPYPQASEASSSAFPFPTILPSRSSTWPSACTSTMASTSSFRYPQPHARSHPSASFNLTLQGIKDSPIPPSLLERRRSSTSSTFSSTSTATVDSVASEASSTWGNWRIDSPVPALSRCGSIRSETSSTRKVELKTPETAVFLDFEDVAVEGRHARAGSFELDLGLENKTKSMAVTRPRLFNNAPRVALPISKSPIKSTTTNERPKLERKGTPLVLPMMRPSELFTAKTGMTPLSTISTTPTTATTKPVTRPTLTRKLTPHPEFDLTLSNSASLSTSRKAPTLSSSIVEEESEDEEDDEETIFIPNLPVRGRPLERKTWRTPMMGWNEGANAGMRRFSSVIEEGKVWLAV